MADHINGDEIKKLLLKGYELYRVGNYAEAYPIFEKGADAGFVPAHTYLGHMLYNGGNGVKQNIEKAIQYYLYAAELGEPDAQVCMGNIYLRCDEIEKAFQMFEKAAEKDSSDALFNLGNLYYTGIKDVKTDYKKAAAYLERFAAMVQDDDEVLHLLGRCYVFMEDSNLDKALELFRKSAVLGNEKAAKDRDALELGGQIVNI